MANIIRYYAIFRILIILKIPLLYFHLPFREWSGGVMVLGKLQAPGRPTNFDFSSARAYCAYIKCGWGLFRHFFSRLSFLLSFSLSLGDGPI